MDGPIFVLTSSAVNPVMIPASPAISSSQTPLHIPAGLPTPSANIYGLAKVNRFANYTCKEADRWMAPFCHPIHRWMAPFFHFVQPHFVRSAQNAKSRPGFPGGFLMFKGSPLTIYCSILEGLLLWYPTSTGPLWQL
jgi:hypothetical protein